MVFEARGVEGTPARFEKDSLRESDFLKCPGVEKWRIELDGGRRQDLVDQLRPETSRHDDSPSGFDPLPAARLRVGPVFQVQPDDVADRPLLLAERLDQRSDGRQNLCGTQDLCGATRQSKIPLDIDRKKYGTVKVRHRVPGHPVKIPWSPFQASEVPHWDALLKNLVRFLKVSYPT